MARIEERTTMSELQVPEEAKPTLFLTENGETIAVEFDLEKVIAELPAPAVGRKLLPLILASDYSALRTVAEQAIARVAELERERDEANKARALWANNAGSSADEVIRLTATVEQLRRDLAQARAIVTVQTEKLSTSSWKRLETAEAAITRLREALLSIKRKARALADDRDTHNRGLWDGCAAEADAALSAEQPKGSAA